MMSRLIFVFGVCFSFLGCTTSPNALKTVEKVNLSKYAGKWFEIASFPNRFQKGCSCTTASYKVKNGFVEVFNECFLADKGEWERITGKAFPVEKSNNTKLKVQFFWPFKGDYYIIDLDESYQFALVGAPSRDYLWILSRTPDLPQKVIEQLKEKANSLGFDTTKLNYTKHNC